MIRYFLLIISLSCGVINLSFSQPPKTTEDRLKDLERDVKLEAKIEKKMSESKAEIEKMVEEKSKDTNEEFDDIKDRINWLNIMLTWNNGIIVFALTIIGVLGWIKIKSVIDKKIESRVEILVNQKIEKEINTKVGEEVDKILINNKETFFKLIDSHDLESKFKREKKILIISNSIENDFAYSLLKEYDFEQLKCISSSHFEGEKHKNIELNTHDLIVFHNTPEETIKRLLDQNQQSGLKFLYYGKPNLNILDTDDYLTKIHAAKFPFLLYDAVIAVLKFAEFAPSI